MGIGGTGVSSQALVLAARGHRVSGCDAGLSATTEQLVAEGIAVV
ncbi:MAG: Mur ligase domain-containing protein, partial [Candidatus Dormibacteraeota bacterium]|nr:Mur ligase domain-containing protein [Candidatus Dormibacteraeota bacterium]